MYPALSSSIVRHLCKCQSSRRRYTEPTERLEVNVSRGSDRRDLLEGGSRLQDKAERSNRVTVMYLKEVFPATLNSSRVHFGDPKKARCIDFFGSFSKASGLRYQHPKTVGCLSQRRIRCPTRYLYTCIGFTRASSAPAQRSSIAVFRGGKRKTYSENPDGIRFL